MFKNYLVQIGLDKYKQDRNKINNESIVKKIFSQKIERLSEEQVTKLYVFDVPKIGPDGACSITSEKEEKPYNLAETFGIPNSIESLKNHYHTKRLWRLKQVVDTLQQQTNVDWLGVYRKTKNAKGKEVLVKEAYWGLFSRAEFPLTEEFAAHSNNSTVGLTGKTIVVSDVSKYEGPYYQCDVKVRSELCLPILDSHNTVIGIIDAESFQPNYFNSYRVLSIAQVAFDLGQIQLGI